MGMIWLVPVAGVVAILMAIYFTRDILRRDAGTPKMQEIGGTIYEGAMAFLKRQYRTIALLALATAVVIGLLVGYFEGSTNLGLRTAVAFLMGAFFSGLSGFIGMFVAVKANVRTASASLRSLQETLTLGLRGGAVPGLLIVAMSLLGVTAIYYAYGGRGNPGEAPLLIVGFGFGASFVALFAQLGGGIYTKAADVGADLVGKIEAGIPEDDPRNAAVIADLVGDNVGDCAGRGADLFESFAAENIGAMILGVAVGGGIAAVTKNPTWVVFPLVASGLGLLCSVIGLFFARGREDEDPMKALNRGYYATVVLAILGMFLATKVMLDYWQWFFAAGVVGIFTSVAFVYITQYYTVGGRRPVKEIAEASRTGAGTNIITGVAVGFECTFSTAITVGVALLLSFWLGKQTGLEHGGIYGTAVATLGMLMTCAYILSMDAFGPITDNAGGINEMAGSSSQAREITDRLDAVGNTTKALTKGYAMGSAALAAFLLFSAYLQKVTELGKKADPAFTFGVVNLTKVEVFVGALLAVMLVFLFSSLALRGVGRTAQSIIQEVRRQFRADPGIMAGTSRPDYAAAVDITTRSALRNMVAPGLLAVGMPVATGLVFRALNFQAYEVMAAFLMVGTIAGIIMATFMNNGGGAWDNAKKMIEAGRLKDDQGNPLKKGSPAHAAAVVGDTVGDPFKDTVGPSLHVLVKLLGTITLVLSPLFIL